MRIGTVIVVISILHQSVMGHTIDDSDRLFQNITSGYRRHFRPVFDQTKILQMSVYMDLVAIHDFVEVQGKFTTTSVVFLEWTDEFLRWNPDDFGGVQTLTIQLANVWFPILLHANSAEKMEQLTEDWHLLRVNSSGYVMYYFGDVFTSSCGVDIAYYPWDTQRCEIQFSIIGYYNEIEFIPASDKISTGFYGDNGAWDLTDTNTALRFDGTFISFELYLTRKSRFVVINVILPIVLMSFLNVLIFLIPTDSGERISFCLTVLLAIAVLLTVVGDNLPKTSNPMAWYSYYLLSILIISICITFATILSVHFYHKSGDDHVNHWWQRFVRCTKCRRRHTMYKQETTLTAENKRTSDNIPQCIKYKTNGLQSRHVMRNFRDWNRKTASGFNRNQSDLLQWQINQGQGQIQTERRAFILSGHGIEKELSTWQDVSIAIDKVAFLLFLVVLIVDNAVFMYAIAYGL